MDTLQLFVEIARHGSFSAVARRRGVDVSKVSRALAALEADLGTLLMQRTTRSMVLTEAGEAFLSRVTNILEEFAAARELVRARSDGPSGTLRLTASVAFGQRVIIPLVPAFRAEFPRLSLDLVLSDANVDLIADKIDLAIRLGSGYGAGVIGSRLMATRFRVVASPAYLAKAGMPAEPAELGNRSCLLFALPEYRARWLFRHKGKTQNVPVHGELLASNALALRDLALAGLGPSLLAQWLVGEDIASGALIDLFPEHDVTATSFDTAAWLLYPSRKYLPRKVRAGIDFLRASLGGPAP